MNDAMNELRRVIEEIIEFKQELNDYYDIKPSRPLPGPPSPTFELVALEEHLQHDGLRFPPSYRAFLEVCNGITGFDTDLNLLSAKGVTNPVDESLESDFPTLSKFVIALGNRPAFISFDPQTVDESGEMEVVWVADDGAEDRYPSFAAFLRTYRDVLHGHVKREQEDRKHLHD